MADPFTIRIFVPDGDPEGVRIIDRMNWTGTGISFPRIKWHDIKTRPELQRAGIYILTGYRNDDDLPTLYVGRAEGISARIDAHQKEKDFWDRAIVFISNSGGLNQAHAMWLEYSLIKRASETKRCHLDNGNSPQEPFLSEAEKADTDFFLKQILQILPLVELRAFEFAKPVASPHTSSSQPKDIENSYEMNTIIVPAKSEGFERVFIGENVWYAVRISGGMLDKIKYIAAYRTQPISSITHVAPIDRIEPYGEEGKYKLMFSSSAQEIGPIGNAPLGSMQGIRYTNFQKLKNAKTFSDLI